MHPPPKADRIDGREPEELALDLVVGGAESRGVDKAGGEQPLYVGEVAVVSALELRERLRGRVEMTRNSSSRSGSNARSTSTVVARQPTSTAVAPPVR